MTGPPAFSDTPQGSKTGTAGSFGNDPASEAFLAECTDDDPIIEFHRTWPDPRKFPDPRPQHRTQTFDLTYRFTGTTKHDPRLMLETTFRNGLPRGVTSKEVTDA